jgi:DNA-binding transcriptional LysR family regulator
MLDGVSLDQLRTFISAVDEGSFSAAGRKFNRVQSAVSALIAGLEEQIGLVLFDRGGRFPKLTPEGVLLLADARNIVSGVDKLKARARLIKSGVEPELSVVIDVFFPTSVVSAVAKTFAEKFPMTPLRLFVEALGAAYEPVLDGRCSLGILPPLPQSFPSLVSERLGDLPVNAVAAPTHPLARFKTRIPRQELARYVQLVLTDRSSLTSGRDFTVASPSTWRLADLSTKHAFLKDCVGWGGMPLHMIEKDLADGSLVVLDVDHMPRCGYMLTMSAFHRPSDPPGPAGEWFVNELKARWRRSRPMQFDGVNAARTQSQDSGPVGDAGQGRTAGG